MIIKETTPFGRIFHRWLYVLTFTLMAGLFASGSAFADHSPGHKGDTGGGSGGNDNNLPVIEDQLFSLDENRDPGTVVGQVVATSTKKNTTLEFAITGGDDTGSFLIDQFGVLTTALPLDHETISAHVLTVQVTDKFGSSTALVTVSVGDVNEPPTASDASFDAPELELVGSVVGTVQASDPDTSPPFSTLSYAVTGGNDDNAFDVDAEGNLFTLTALDFDVTPTYNLIVEVTDGGGLSDTANVTVDVLPNVVPSNLADIDGTNGFRVPGLTELLDTGWGVTILGDVNGDGIDDFVVSSLGGGPIVSSAYVIFGNDQGFAPNFDLTSLNGTNGFRFDGTDVNDFTGTAINGAGDINNDGKADILIGASGVSNPNGTTGAVYVVFGSQQFAPVMTAADLDGELGFQLLSEPGQSGLGNVLTLAPIGDLNGDGVDDFGAGLESGSFNGVSLSGMVYAIYGRDTQNGDPDFEPVIDVANLDTSTGLVLYGAPGDGVGSFVNPTGDINGDTFGDFSITLATFSRGLYVVFGNLTPVNPPPGEQPSFDLTTLDGTNGFIVDAPPDNFLFGGTGGGDINGDGHPDAVIGSTGEDINGLEAAGAGYVIFGRDSGFTWPAIFDLTSLDGSNGFRLKGELENGRFGFPIDNRSDIDGDGLDDIVGGALPLPDPFSQDPPPLPPAFYYIVAGSNLGFPAEIDLADPSIGSKIEVPETTAFVGAGGDINDDGVEDFILGSYRATTINGETGEAVVVYGGEF